MNCTFCSKNISQGKGTMFVKKDGRILYFCSNKCEKNMIKLKRTPRKIKWTGEAHAVKQESVKKSKQTTKGDKK